MHFLVRTILVWNLSWGDPWPEALEAFSDNSNLVLEPFLGDFGQRLWEAFSGHDNLVLEETSIKDPQRITDVIDDEHIGERNPL